MKPSYSELNLYLSVPPLSLFSTEKENNDGRPDGIDEKNDVLSFSR